MADFNLHQMMLPISIKQMNFTTGTWTYAANAGNPYFAKTATDETSVITIPIKIPVMRNEIGVQLDKVEVGLRISTLALDAVVSGVLTQANHYKAVTAAGTNMDTTAVTITETGTAVTADGTDRLYTAIVSTPALTGTLGAVSFELQLTINSGATTIPRVYDAIAYYTSAQ